MKDAKRSKRFGERLERLICSGLIPAKDLETYAQELRDLADELAGPGYFRSQSRLLKALANDTRLKMLRLLSLKDMCVCELTIALGLTQPTASHHLNILQNVELIEDRKEGKWVFYSVAKPEVVQHLFEFLGFSHRN
jgi:ArsR family transcriptional regulator